MRGFSINIILNYKIKIEKKKLEKKRKNKEKKHYSSE
jgi:hypothetical protein